MKTLIGIQDDYIATVNDGLARWAHSKRGGHVRRIRIGARRKAMKELRTLGFSEETAKRAIDDASEVADLQRACGE